MKGYLSHESFWTDVRMFLKMLKISLIISLVLQIFYLFFSFCISFSQLASTPVFADIKLPRSAVIKYYVGSPGGSVPVERDLRFLFGAEKVPLEVYRDVLNRRTLNGFTHFSSSIKEMFHKSFKAYYFALIYIVIFYLKSYFEVKDKYVRGISLLPIRRLNRRLRRGAKKDKVRNLRIGKSVIPRKMEPAHLLILGAAGSGKSVLLNQLFQQINERKTEDNPERVVVYDMKGEFIEKQYTEGDYIFSPFDVRTVKWSFFNEIKTLPDFDVISKSLYISPDEKSEYWYNCAKDVFRTGLIYLYMNGKTLNNDIWEFFSGSLEDIKSAFNTLPLEERGAIKHIDKSDATASANIISILQERLQFFRYLIDMDGDFSFKNYVRSKSTRNLYLLNIDIYKDIFKPLMSLVVDTMIREVLSLEDDLERRVFFMIDELGSLYKLESILDLVTVGRSKGAPLICANQDLGRLEETYGKPNIKTFFNNFNSLVVFRINEPESADFLSKAIGEQQLIRSTSNAQIAPSDFGDRKGFSEHEKLERVIIPSELHSFKDFEAILRVANYGIAKTKIPRKFFEKVNPHFIMKDFVLEKDDAAQQPANHDNYFDYVSDLKI